MDQYFRTISDCYIVQFVISWGHHATLCSKGKLFSMCVKDFVQQKLSSVAIFLVFLTLTFCMYSDPQN